jgi:hypothetical protein
MEEQIDRKNEGSGRIKWTKIGRKGKREEGKDMLGTENWRKKQRTAGRKGERKNIENDKKIKQ